MTRFTFQSHPQGDIWVSRQERFTNKIVNLLGIRQAGFVYYAGIQLGAIKEALVNFQQKNDAKAAVIVSPTYSLDQVCSVMMASMLIPTDITITAFDSCHLFL